VLLLAVAVLIGTGPGRQSRSAAAPGAGSSAAVDSTGGATSPPASASPSFGAAPSGSASRSVPATPGATRTPSPAAPRPAPTTATVAATYEGQVLDLVNVERAKVGCQPVTADSRLAAAARGHSVDMATRDYFDHDTPDGVKFGTRITNAGYAWSTAGENIAAGQSTPAEVMKSWMNSPGHRANILNCAYRNLGVGLAYSTTASYRTYWTQDFAAP